MSFEISGENKIFQRGVEFCWSLYSIVRNLSREEVRIIQTYPSDIKYRNNRYVQKSCFVVELSIGSREEIVQHGMYQ